MDNQSILITVKQAAGVLSISTWQVYEYARRRMFPLGVVVYLGRSIRFNSVELDRWILEGGIGAARFREVEL